jgi:hypothetical protein
VIYSSNGNSIPSEIGNAKGSVGQGPECEEVPVMGMERRALVIQSEVFWKQPLKTMGGF